MGAARARGGDNTWAFGGGDGGVGRWLFFFNFLFFFLVKKEKEARVGFFLLLWT